MAGTVKLPAACPSLGNMIFDPDHHERREVGGMIKCWARGVDTYRCLRLVDPRDVLGLCDPCKKRLRG